LPAIQAKVEKVCQPDALNSGIANHHQPEIYDIQSGRKTNAYLYWRANLCKTKVVFQQKNPVLLQTDKLVIALSMRHVLGQGQYRNMGDDMLKFLVFW